MERPLDDSLLNDAPCGFVSLADDGTMLAANETLAAMLGFARAELTGAHVQTILPPGARLFYNTHVFPLLKMHGRVEEIYLALRDTNGRDVPVLLNAVRREREGRGVSDCVFVRMSQRHAYEDQLLQARRLAEEASEAKARFLSMMSHDVRTPLTAIQGYADLLASGFYGPLSEQQQEPARTIKDAAREVGRLLDDILAFAKLESGKVEVHLQTVPLADAVARAETLIRPRVEQANLSFEAALCGDDLAASADPDRLQQVLLNLLTNAIKFTPPGGKVSVSCDRADDRVLIRVRDTGVGIARDQLEHIFDPFVQLSTQPEDPTQRGVGLGLAISRDLARAMGGELTADSTPGQGSVFTIDLPAALSVEFAP